MVHYTTKVVMLGEGGVGKTSLIRRYVEQTFSHNYITTVGSNFLLKKVQLDKNTRMTMQLWDISGQDSFRTIRAQYYLHSHGGILVFDLTRKSTFTELNKWHTDFIKKAGKVPLLVFGNKMDLINQRETSSQEGSAIANEFDSSYFETSALNGTGVEDAFHSLAWKIVDDLNRKRRTLTYR
ncbi:MAG: GTP-binding protein [Candidatus Heimdallarchaeota archaeon]|nr:GTP-binding protein [Candidatus Heimdallarchaeota archaeon]